MKLRLALWAVIVALVASTARADNATDRVRGHEPKMSYLDDGAVRVGVDLDAGGAITYLSRSGADQNLINSYDFGRQVQMSYYAGPAPFSADGKQPKPEWAFIGWNPIQVGDAFGNPSRVLESRNDGRSIYVRCVPMHWPLDHVPGECTYECWLELAGNAVHARCRLVNDRPDHTQYPARHQELPAVYTNGPWHKLITYAGDRPFAGGEVTRIEKKAGERGPWSSWTATESWAALVDDQGFGLGVYTPGVCAFKGGFAGKPGAGGPHDDPTGYIAPSPAEVIDWNITHQYRYDLIVGTVDEIRRHVYAHAKRERPSYRFAADRQGWTYARATDAGWPIRGDLDVRLDQDDPQLIGPVGCWSTAEAHTLVIKAASRTTRTDARVYWRALGEPAFTADHSAGFALLSDGAYHTYRLPLPSAGALTQLRFDPVSAGGPDQWIKVRSISLEK